MRNEPEIRLERLPRMADFAIWSTAAETAFGYQRGEFITACDGLRLNPRRFLAALAPDDHDDVITDPELARAFAKSLEARLVS